MHLNCNKLNYYIIVQVFVICVIELIFRQFDKIKRFRFNIKNKNFMMF